MTHWRHRRRLADVPAEDLDAALADMNRALTDARQLNKRAGEVAGRMSETVARNHFREAVERAMRRQ